MQRRMMIAVFLIALLVGVVGAQGNPSDTCTDPNMWEYDNWRSTDDECTLNELVSVEVHASYPKELADRYPFAKSVIFDYINEERRKYWEIAEFVTRPGDNPHFVMMTLNINSELFEHSDAVASVLFQSMYLEGQGRVFGFQTFTFDLKGGKTLDLKDIFIESADPYLSLAPFVREALFEIFGDCCDNASLRLSAPIPDNYSRWVLTDKSLLIFYALNDVVSSGAGIGEIRTVEIPLADLKDVLKPEFLPKTAP